MLQELAARGGRLSAFEARHIKGYAHDWVRSLGVPADVTDSGRAFVTAFSPSGRRPEWERALARAGLVFSYGQQMYFVDFGRVRNLRALAAASR